MPLRLKTFAGATSFTLIGNCTNYDENSGSNTQSFGTLAIRFAFSCQEPGEGLMK